MSGRPPRSHAYLRLPRLGVCARALPAAVRSARELRGFRRTRLAAEAALSLVCFLFGAIVITTFPPRIAGGATGASMSIGMTGDTGRPRRAGIARPASHRLFPVYFPFVTMGSQEGTMPKSQFGQSVETPFGPPVEEILLDKAPLVLVLAQLRFPPILVIDDERFVAQFQEQIRSSYPVLSSEDQTAVLIGLQGAATGPRSVIWRFATEPAAWEVSLSKDFVALSTSMNYHNRDDFIDRLTEIISAMSETIQPKVCSRIGIRYVDRINNVADIAKLVRPEVLGVSEMKLGRDDVRRAHAISDLLYEVPPDSRLHARWGRIPSGLTFDPAIDPVDNDSWVLDLDQFTRSPVEWDVDAVADRAREFCDGIYRYFRWVVSDEFLRQHGAKK